MTVESNKESVEEVQPENVSTQPEDPKKDRLERRPGLSKREMMEELSRQRFPWAE